MGIVPNHLEVSIIKRVDVRLGWVDLEFRKGARGTFELFFQSIDMVQVDMSIANRVHEFTGFPTGDLCHKTSEECVRSNVKGNAQTHISGSLIQLARELILLRVNLSGTTRRGLSMVHSGMEQTYIELTEHVAWRKRHFIEIRRVPCRHDDSAVFWRILDLVDTIS